MKYKLVILDFDGTLADSLPWFIGALNIAAEKYRFPPVQPENVEGLRDHGARAVMKKLRIPFWKLPFIVRHMRAMMTREIERIPLFPGTGGLLRELSLRGVILAVVTSNTARNVQRLLGPENVARIRHLECGASIFGKKGKYKKILRKSRVRPEETLCIGDEVRDLEAAHKAGIPFGAVAWGYNSILALQARKPLVTFAKMEEIARIWRE